MNKTYQGDALEVLKTFPDNFIDCCVTSPPYFGLRDYGTGEWSGGDDGCDHKKPPGGGHQGKSLIGSGERDIEIMSNNKYSHVCKKCGAKRIDKQLGLEKTPDEFVAKMVLIFEEVKRVLRPSGNLWLNLGDSYAGSGKGCQSEEKRSENWQPEYGNKGKRYGLKPKDLIGIPWAVAFALRNSGWWLRQDIIWHKPNPMPESVTDRCTKAHEYIFLLSKSAKYYYDAESISEKSIWFEKDSRSANGRTPHKSGKSVMPESQYAINGVGYSENGMRNKRSVWTVTTKPTSEAHFATFPPELIVDCIKAGCPEDGIVLDPFNGSGTTRLVAEKLGRNSIGIELNPKYIQIENRRRKKELGMFEKIAS